MRFYHSFRRIPSSQSLRDHSESRMEKIRRFEIKSVAIYFVYSMERQKAKVELQVIGSQGNFQACVLERDFYTAVDRVVAKIQAQMGKKKGRIKDHKKARLSRHGKLYQVNHQLESDFAHILDGTFPRKVG